MRVTKKRQREIDQEKTDRVNYETRILSEDEFGSYKWTPEEKQEIDKLSDAIKQNQMMPRFGGPQSIRDLSRKEHESDAKIIQQWKNSGCSDSSYGKVICAELRRRRAARELAFMLAGIGETL
jgi:hypothetical protein